MMVNFARILVVGFCVGWVIGCQEHRLTNTPEAEQELNLNENNLSRHAFQELQGQLESPALFKTTLEALANSTSDTLMCLDPDSVPVLFQKTTINEQLGRMPYFQKILGFAMVDDCVSAFSFMEEKYRIVETFDSTMVHEAKEEELEYGPATLAKDAVSLRGGTDINGRGSVEIVTTGNCTGFLINSRVVVTAAHCLAKSLILNGVQTRVGRNHVTINYFDPNISVTQKRTLLSGTATLVMHPSWVGSGDSQSDIGLIIADNSMTVNNSDYLRLYVGTMSDGRWNFIYGRGRNAFSGTGSGILRYGREYVDWYGSNHFYATESGSIQTCLGDSGGPWVRSGRTVSSITDAVSGVTSNMDTHNSNPTCTRPGGRMRACRISAKVSWISDMLVLASLNRCTTIGGISQCY